jgi:hypothetical protein
MELTNKTQQQKGRSDAPNGYGERINAWEDAHAAADARQKTGAKKTAPAAYTRKRWQP